MFKNYIKIAWKVLSRKRLYTLVTLLGISFPLIIITLVVSFLTHITSNSYPQTKFKRVVAIDRFAVEIEKGKNYWTMSSSNTPYKFYENYVLHFNTPEIACFSQNYQAEITGNSKSKNLSVKSSDENFWQVADYKIVEGREFNNKDIEKTSNYAVIDEKTKTYFFGKTSPIGKEISVGNKKYRVIGVVKNADVTKFQTFANVFIPFISSEKISEDNYLRGEGNVLFLLRDKKDEKQLELELKKAIDHFDLGQINGCKKIDANIAEFNYAELIKRNVRILFNLDVSKKYILPVSVLLVIFFFLVLPALNLIYINLSRASERSEEVGIRKGFGGNRQTIFRQFIFENFFITVLGGIIALVVSILVLFLINRSQFLPGCYIKFNVFAFLISIAIWLFLGFLSGVLPAVRISKTPVISAIQGVMNKNGYSKNKWLKRENFWLTVELCCVFVALFSIIDFFTFFGINLLTPIGFDFQKVYEIGMRDKTKNFMDQDDSARDKVFEWIKQNPLISENTRQDGCKPYEGTSHFSEDLKYNNHIIKGDKVLYVELRI